jgi:hypothetical protein
VHPPGKPTLVVIDTREGRQHLSARFLPAGWPPTAVAKAIVDQWRAREDPGDKSKKPQTTVSSS